VFAEQSGKFFNDVFALGYRKIGPRGERGSRRAHCMIYIGRNGGMSLPHNFLRDRIQRFKYRATAFAPLTIDEKLSHVFT